MKLFIFGSTGDLVKKKVLPALEEIKELEIINIGRKNMDNDQFNEEHCKNCSSKLKERLTYKQINFNKDFCEECTSLLNKEAENYFYISLPPSLIYTTLLEISTLKEKGYKIRVLIEKPFGNSLEEAEKLKKIIIEKNLEEDIYLADHYLFKEDILNLNVDYKIENIEIKSLEKEGINSRSYYDDVGAIKDMIQSHLLNVLFKILNFKDEEISFQIKKVKIGQYKQYKKEIGKSSNTETYVKIEGEVIKADNNPIKITLETGKMLDKKEISIKINNNFRVINDEINPYITMIKQFISENKKNFPKIKQSIKAWEITEQILGYISKNNLNLEEY